MGRNIVAAIQLMIFTPIAVTFRQSVHLKIAQGWAVARPFENIINKSEFPAGHVIFNQGDPGRVAYFIESGSVRISRRAGKRDIVLDVVHAGQFFGKVALLDGGDRLASATAQEHTVCVVVSKDQFEASTTSKDPLVRVLVHMLCTYIRRNTNLIA
jgi:CRP/FNR family transcriptional regulator, cyclic AMP receptor protein